MTITHATIEISNNVPRRTGADRDILQSLKAAQRNMRGVISVNVRDVNHVQVSGDTQNI